MNSSNVFISVISILLGIVGMAFFQYKKQDKAQDETKLKNADDQVAIKGMTDDEVSKKIADHLNNDHGNGD